MGIVGAADSELAAVVAALAPDRAAADAGKPTLDARSAVESDRPAVVDTNTDDPDVDADALLPPVLRTAIISVKVGRAVLLDPTVPAADAVPYRYNEVEAAD